MTRAPTLELGRPSPAESAGSSPAQPQHGAMRSSRAAARSASCQAQKMVAPFLLLLAASLFSTLLTPAMARVEGEPVEVSVNKVWPYYNPTETYAYYDVMPYCRPEKIEHKHMSVGQVLRGDRLMSSIYTVKYLRDVEAKVVCERDYTAREDLGIFRKAIDRAYVTELSIAGLPVVAPVGYVHGDGASRRYFLTTHLMFDIGYNEGDVVSVNVTSDKDTTEITDYSMYDLVRVQFKYSVTWHKSPISKNMKLQKQLAGLLVTPSSSGLSVHWLAIVNSFVLVLFISALLLVVILRVVRTDLSRYLLRLPDEEYAATLEDETGWKLLHADVFRPPPHRMWFCACIGSGAHLCLVAISIILLGCTGPYLRRGASVSLSLLLYLLTSFVAGYLSANLYRRLGGVKWKWNVIVTCLMFSGPVFIVWSTLNTIAITYRSTAAWPFTTACSLFGLWVFVTLPLTVLGSVLGRRAAEKEYRNKAHFFPCKTNKLAREVPMVRWYHSPWLQVLVAGFLPFSAIYIELHYILLSVWGDKIYTLYGVLLLALLMLLFVASTTSILLTYFHLNGEDYRWWWRSFISGGSVAFFFLAHSLHHFLTNTRMHGFLQCSFYFGYSLVFAWASMLSTGFVTFSATYLFICYIYSRVKLD